VPALELFIGDRPPLLARVKDPADRRWPAITLALLTGLNLLDYLDRQLLAAVLPALQTELKLGDEQAGAIASAFMLGYFLTAPIFGYLGDRLPRRWLIAAGVLVWSLGTAMSGHANAYVSLLFFRALVGFGEASFGTVSPGWIADLFSRAKRNNAITLFYFAIPVGSAIGYLMGGYMAVHHGWRSAFLLAGYPGILFGLLVFFLPEPVRGASEVDATDAPEPSVSPGWRSYLELGRYPAYLLVVAGYAAQTFALGGFSLWAPTFLYRVHHMPLDQAGFFFSASLAATGLVATLGGGFWATRWQKRSGNGYAWVLALSSLAAAPVAFLAFSLADLGSARTALVGTMFFLFLTTGPVNTLILETVPVKMRATSMAASIFAIHMFGDLWSPRLVGYLSDRWHDLQRAVLWVLPGALIISAIFWLWLALRRQRSVNTLNIPCI
jgi:MFS family permease